MKEIVTITGDDTSFSAYYRAETLLKAEGYTVGSMQRDNPIGFADSNKCEFIAKWENLDYNDRKLLDGVMTSKDFRYGDIDINYYEKD